MLLLTSTSDIIRVVSGSAGAIDVHASWVDNLSGALTPGRTNTASITTATTTTVVAAPAASTQRNLRNLSISNEHASVSNVITVEHFDGTTAETIWKGTLSAGERVVFDEIGQWKAMNSLGVEKREAASTIFNNSVAAQGAGFSTDTYATGSFVLFPTPPKVGTIYRCRISVSKTAAGTATPILTVRVGTAGTTADTGRGTHTFSAGTAATDTGMFMFECVFRTVGSGTSAVLQSHCALISQPTTGFSSLLKGTQATSGGFDSTVAALGIGISINGGTSASWTLQIVDAEIINGV
jgi:hypothetical protein